jgi:hypothetical protein
VGVLLQKSVIFFINWGMATDIKLKDYILYKYKERIKEKKDSLYYMLSIISSGNRGCCSSTVPIREPPLFRTEEYDNKTSSTLHVADIFMSW